MKVLFITGWYPKDNHSIAGIFVKEHALAASLFNDVAVIFGYEDENQKERYRFFESEEDSILTLRFSYRHPRFFNYFSTYAKGMLTAFQRLQENFQPDIIHANIYITAPIAAHIKKLYHIPFVITEHWSGLGRDKVLKRRTMKKVLRMKEAEKILPVSQALQEGIERYGIEGPFEIVPNAVNTKIFYPSGNVQNNQPIKQLLTVASLRPIKGIPDLLRALSLLKERRSDFFLTIVGGGDQREEYQELSDQLGLEKHVHFLGIKTKEEIAHLMRSSNLFVLPTLFETLSCAILEAMACGSPIVSTTVGGIPEIVNEERGILVEPGNPEKLAKAINYMLNHDQQWSREKIASYVHEHFSFEAIGKKLTNIYQEVKRKQV